MNWDAVFAIAHEALEWVQKFAAFAKTVEDLPREERIRRCVEVAADYGDARIPLPWGFEELDGPALRLALKPYITKALDRLYPQPIPNK